MNPKYSSLGDIENGDLIKLRIENDSYMAIKGADEGRAMALLLTHEYMGDPAPVAIYDNEGERRAVTFGSNWHFEIQSPNDVDLDVGGAPDLGSLLILDSGFAVVAHDGEGRMAVGRAGERLQMISSKP